jgi:hypothetical protein
MMKGMLAHATTEELYKLADTIIAGEDLTDEQAALLDDIGTELEKRGEWKKISMEEAETLGEQIRQRAAAETRAETDKETPSWVAQLLQDAEEDVRQRNAKRRKVTVAAAGLVVVLLVSNSISAWAGFDFIAWAFARVQHGFHMITAGESEETEKVEAFELQSVRSNLAENDVLLKLPTWLPEKFYFQEFNDTNTVAPFYMTAWFTDGTSQFSLQIREAGSQEELDSWMEAGNTEELGELDKRVISGVTYAVASNYGKAKAIWHENNYELTIQGDLTSEELTAMLESIT